MKRFVPFLLLLSSMGAGCQTARQRDLARAWETSVTAEVEVVAYDKGQENAFFAVDWGFDAQLYPPNASKVRVLSPPEFAGQIYTVAMPDTKVANFDPEPWKEPGRKMQVTLSLAYLKYRPWGFIPFNYIHLKETPHPAPVPTGRDASL